MIAISDRSPRTPEAPQRPPLTGEAHKHLAYLDSMRALAALYVAANHAFLQIHWADFARAHPLEMFLVGLLGYGPSAVAIFIVLSGFCLTLPVVRRGGVLRGGAAHFFVRRAWRILPPYYASIALSLFLIWLFIGHKTGTHWDVSLPVTAKSVAIHLLLVQDLCGEPASINHVLWSVAVEWRIYFAFPLLLICWKKILPLWTTLILLAVSLGVAFVSQLVIRTPLHFHYFGLFGMGMFACGIAYSRDEYYGKWRNLPWNAIAILLTVAALTSSLLPVSHGGLLPLTIRDIIVGIWASSFLVLTSRHPHAWHHRVLSFRPLAFLGTFAYSIYLIHAPLLQLLWQYAYQPLSTHPLWMLMAFICPGL